MAIDDEILMAYADGALSTEEAAKVEMAMAQDEALAERVALFADSRTAMKRAFGAAPAVPDALALKVRDMIAADATRRAPQSNVIDLASRRRSVPFWQVPLAASVALAVGLFGGWLGQSGGQSGGQADSGLAIAALDDPALIGALETVASGERVTLDSGAEFAAVATFRDSAGQLCREFEHGLADGSTVVVACRGDQDWSVQFAVAGGALDSEGYAPASSLEVLDAWMSASEAGAPLSADDEAAALSALR
jgi:anti-sigma factor RsiW